MLRMMSVTTVAIFLVACASNRSELSVTNKSSKPVEVELGGLTTPVAAGKSVTLQTQPGAGQRLKVAFVEDGKGYLFSEAADHSGRTDFVWFGNGRLALKV